MAVTISFLVLIFSIIAHEVAHGYAADSLGDPTPRLAGRLTLNPLPHIDPVGSVLLPGLLVLTGSPIFFGWAKPVPYNPYNLRSARWGEFLVATAGVATNLLVALVFGLIVRFGGSLGLDQTMLDLAGLIAFVNLFIGFFNLIPFPPLDGFTALRSALPWSLSSGLHRFEASMRRASALSLLLFLFVFSSLLAAPFSNLVFGIYQVLTGSGG